MQHIRGLVSTAQALRCTFVTPLEITRTQFLRHNPIQSQTQSRIIHSTRPRPSANTGTLNTGAKQNGLQDENIPANFVQIASEDGKLQPPQRLRDALASINRSQYFILQVSPGSREQLPVCRVVSKQAVREYVRSKEKAAHASKTSLKQIELNWAIDSHDLSHRLKKLTEFLEKGRKVEISLTRKKGKRAPTPDEVKQVMASVVETTQKADAAPVKPIEGEPGRRVLMVVKKKDT